jgi:hypothetical protein
MVPDRTIKLKLLPQYEAGKSIVKRMLTFQEECANRGAARFEKFL